MLAQAVKHAEDGKAVYIVCATLEHAKVLQRAHPEMDEMGIKFETWATLQNLDPLSLKLRGAWPSVKVMVDHAAIENRFAALLEELHRYDEERENEKDSEG